MSSTILICDDDELIVSSLRGLFLLETDYDVVEFTDPREATRELEKRPVDVVISDFLMPEMNGVEFLGAAKRTQPDAVRVLLTGFADKENAIRAINEVGLYQYLEKPWDNDGLLLAVKNGLRERGLRRQLSERIAEFEQLIARHESLEDRHSMVERELEMAARVQESLFPSEPPKVEGYDSAWEFRPSSTLGGDFYDVAPMGLHTAILIADVSGHGAQAALTSMLLKASFQEAAPSATDPRELMGAMSERLHRFLPSGLYACAGLICLRPGDDSVLVANGGLPHPQIIRADGSIEEMPLEGLPLGLMANSPEGLRDQASVALSTDDLLVLATDGLAEARDEAGAMFERARLQETLKAQAGDAPAAVVAALAEAAEEFSGGSLSDDLTLAAVARRG